jgi:hypothetical protein
MAAMKPVSNVVVTLFCLPDDPAPVDRNYGHVDRLARLFIGWSV